MFDFSRAIRSIADGVIVRVQVVYWWSNGSVLWLRKSLCEGKFSLIDGFAEKPVVAVLDRQQATINTNKTTTVTNSNKYRNSALFLEQKRLSVQKNLRQLQESSISRDVIRSKSSDACVRSFVFSPVALL